MTCFDTPSRGNSRDFTRLRDAPTDNAGEGGETVHEPHDGEGLPRHMLALPPVVPFAPSLAQDNGQREADVEQRRRLGHEELVVVRVIWVLGFEGIHLHTTEPKPTT